ncbi:hypothetical protein KPH14_001256 [Odynerus spinipes]|uniref:Uncharacterized protein n=1 Tax=Odynerus spinipes TaxID=1348599 RepID=A0AAD9RUF5_9HYME|nr:hypothetical protein KPH14_001256 [Odynerus spinipes]
MSLGDLDVPKGKDARSRSGEPRTRAEREAYAILAESDDLLSAARQIITRAEALSDADPSRLAVFARRLERIESDHAALFRRAVTLNASSSTDSRVDLSPAREQLRAMMLDFHAQYPIACAHASPAPLPEVTLPVYSGYFREWPRFRSIVEETLLRHPHASEAQRYSALSAALSGEPRSLIASATLLDNCFTSAWQLLLDRYDRPRYICNDFIDALLDLPPVSSPQPAPLQALLSSIREFVQVLHAQPELCAEVGLRSSFIARL